MYIIGAGYTGLLAAILFPKAIILERSPKPFQGHKALLRFRSSHIADLTHIPFTEVKVSKAIWFDGQEVLPAPRFSNLYSYKVTGKYLSRSIDNIDPVTRWIAPNDFYDQLVERVGDRIIWGATVTAITKGEIAYSKKTEQKVIKRENVPIVSTMPLGITARAASMGVSLGFEHTPVHTYRVELITEARTFCTVYFPQQENPIYRASISGNVLILESISDITDKHHDLGYDWPYIKEACIALGIKMTDFSFPQIQKSSQQYGKISPIGERVRKRLIYEMTNRFGIWSVGRFGVWKNILLDDVYFDLFKIRNMISLSEYETRGLQL